MYLSRLLYFVPPCDLTLYPIEEAEVANINTSTNACGGSIQKEQAVAAEALPTSGDGEKHGEKEKGRDSARSASAEERQRRTRELKAMVQVANSMTVVSVRASERMQYKDLSRSRYPPMCTVVR